MISDKAKYGAYSNFIHEKAPALRGKHREKVQTAVFQIMKKLSVPCSMTVGAGTAVLFSALTANSRRNNERKMKYGAYSIFLHEKSSCTTREAP